MDSIKRFLGLDKDGRGVSPTTSLLYSMLLSVIISFLLRWIFPGINPFFRFVVFFGVVFFVFNWINKNHRASEKKRREGR